MTKGTRRVSWVIMNGFFAMCLYLATMQGAVWSKNIVIFLAYFNCIVSCLAGLIPSVKEKVYESGRSVSVWIDVPYDVLMILWMVGFGWFWLAILWAISSFLQSSIYDHNPKDIEEKA